MTAVTERCLQCMLLVACVLVLSFDLATPVSCQGGCVPPLVTPGYMDPITITNGSWTPTTSVTVKIDERYFLWGTTVVNRIQDGEVKWNSPLTCSGVSFHDFEAVVFNQGDYANPPPFHHHYWFVAVPSPNSDGSPRNGETESAIGFGGRVVGAITRIHPNIAFNPQSSDPSLFNYFGSHETGHTFNLKDCLSTTSPQCATGNLSIMSGNGSTVFNEMGPNPCDFNAVAKIYCPPTPTPDPAPTPCTPTIKLDGGTTDSCECNPDDPNCVSPVLIDISGNGFDLTDAAGGVSFDIRGNGSHLRVAWTRFNSDDAWLALDRNGNGMVDNGQELFGNFTPQPIPPSGHARNGFLALAEYDRPNNGGNGDGLITPSDTVFSSLRLWRDLNHNGLSESGELFSLQAMSLEKLELDYKLSKTTDEYGNRFRYRAKVRDGHDAQIGRWAWDVFLVFTP
jgi:hypothetical protein